MSLLYAPILWLLIPLLIYGLKRLKVGDVTLVEILRGVALMVLIIALARPVEKLQPREDQVLIHSVTIALDLSASMRAEDIFPSRLEASKETIRRFLEQEMYDQVALLGFTINPLLLAPPTRDHRLVESALSVLREEYILTRGTDLMRLFKRVVALDNSNPMLILFSDGGDDAIDESIEAFVREHHLEILFIAMATREGATIHGRDGGWLKDKKGDLIVSRLNPTFDRIAKVIDFSSPSAVAKEIVEWIQQHDSQKRGVQSSQSYRELFWIPLLIGLILILISGTYLVRKVALLLSFFGVSLEGGILPDGYYLSQVYTLYEQGAYTQALEKFSQIEQPSLRSELAKAHLYYRLEDYKSAKAILIRLKSDKIKIKQQLLYELGNCEAKLAYYEKAKHYYIQALQLGEDEDIWHNLAWVMAHQKEDHSKVGTTNPNGGAEPNPSAEINRESNSEKPQEAKGSDQSTQSTTGGSRQSKKSQVGEVQSTQSSRQRVMSSKAYDLINEGYIEEERPW